MDYVVYGLAFISIVLSIGGFYYQGPMKLWVIVASIISITFSILAIYYVSFVPILIGFSINWGLKLLGLDPGSISK